MPSGGFIRIKLCQVDQGRLPASGNSTLNPVNVPDPAGYVFDPYVAVNVKEAVLNQQGKSKFRVFDKVHLKYYLK